jgi:hypothetical protein
MDTVAKICLTVLTGLCVLAAVCSGVWINQTAMAVFTGLAGTGIGALAGLAVQGARNDTQVP